MEFAERYIRALARSDNRQDAALLAAALAATGTDGGLGALLCRARYTVVLDDGAGDGLTSAAAGRLLAQLLHLWTAEVTRHGRARRWVADARPWDAHAAQRLYRAVAEHSLAHWLAPQDGAGGGTGVAPPDCRGGFMRERVRDMVSELHRIADRHARLAARRLTSRPARGPVDSPADSPSGSPVRG